MSLPPGPTRAGRRHLAMSFVAATAIKLGVPHPIVQRATRKLLALLREHAPESDMQTLIAALPDVAELDAGAVPRGQFKRLLKGVRCLTTGARTTRVRLQRTGLGDNYVPFASAFANHLRDSLGEAFTSRLISSVPGLRAMSSWPLMPHIADPHIADPHIADPHIADPPSVHQMNGAQASTDPATVNQVQNRQTTHGASGPTVGPESAHHVRPEPPTMS